MSFDLKISQGDLAIGNDGDLAKVESSEKLIQDVLKIAITPLNGNPFFPWYGSSISKTLIGNALETSFVSGMASEQLKNALNTLMQLQKFQSQSSQIVNPGELIAAVEGVSIQQNTADPRFFSVFISILSKQFTRVETNFAITL